jgi:predicted P-loop ATPase
VKVGDVDLEALRRDRDQLWAEAYSLFTEGVPANPIPRELCNVVAEHVASRLEENGMEELLREWLDDLRGAVEKEDVREKLIEKGYKRGQGLDNNLTDAMGRLGWKPVDQKRRGMRRPPAYVKGENDNWLTWSDGLKRFRGAAA